MNTRKATTAIPFTELEVADGNFDMTRNPTIDRIVIHTMVATWQSAAAEFDQYGTQLSAHYGVKKDGGLIHFLEEMYTAYHAGSYSMNLRSIGIEHEDGGDYNGTRPDALYTTSAKLVRDICLFYNIPIDREHIIKHSEVIPTGCPDALDIDRIVREAQNSTPMVTLPQAEVDKLRLDRDGNYNLYQDELKLNAGLQVQLKKLQAAFDEYQKEHPVTMDFNAQMNQPAAPVYKPPIFTTSKPTLEQKVKKFFSFKKYE